MLYITGDTHGDFSSFRTRMNGRGLGKDDVLLITGDFGFDWDWEQHHQWQSLKKDYPVVFCDGNHENFSLLDKLPQKEMFGDVVGDFGNNTYRLLTGHMYTIEGLKVFVFGGACSIDRNMRLPYVSWWPEEIPKNEQIQLAFETLKKHDWKFDLFVSHTCSHDVKTYIGIPLIGFYDPVEDMIERLEDAVVENGGSWGASWFGHFHKDANIDPKVLERKTGVSGRYHCRYEGVSRILGRDSYEPARKHKKDQEGL